MISKETINALELAIRYHAGQTRSNGDPFILHPVRVAYELRLLNNPLITNVALCHDLLEDTTCSEQEILNTIGEEGLVAVKQLTNIVPAGTSFWDKHRQMLEHAKQYNDIAKRVKLSDRWCNLRDSVGCWEDWKVRRYANAGLELVEAMSPLPGDVEVELHLFKQLVDRILTETA